MKIKIRNIFCPVCRRRTYFAGEVVYRSKRTEIIEWKCADCGVIIKSKRDGLGEIYNTIRKERRKLKPESSDASKKRKL